MIGIETAAGDHGLAAESIEAATEAGTGGMSSPHARMLYALLLLRRSCHGETGSMQIDSRFY